MKHLRVKKESAIAAYKEADPGGKRVLVELFGKELFEKITDKIKTFECACAALGLDPNELSTDYDTPDEIAYKKLKVIVKALNEDWVPDWTNHAELKYCPWFRYTLAYGFSFGGIDYLTNVNFGLQHFFFKSSELAEYAAKQFQDLYNDLFVR